jgi:multidrug efflux pump subunit AcrA (membrane-fusion protein)
MVKVRFADRDPRVLPEMSARVAFLERPVAKNEEAPKTAVNPAALVERDGKKFVFVVKEDAVVLTPVVIGERMGDMVEVREGVKPGDKVVVSPPAKLKNGTRVTVNIR